MPSIPEMKKIADKRTKGPWLYDVGNQEVEDYHRDSVCSMNYNDLTKRNGEHISPDIIDANAEFIAMAANNWDKIMVVIERCKYIDDNLAHWFLEPNGAALLKEAFANFEEALKALELDPAAWDKSLEEILKGLD